MPSASMTEKATFIVGILMSSFGGCVVMAKLPYDLCKENKMDPYKEPPTAAQTEHRPASCKDGKFFTKTLPVDVPGMPNAKPVQVTYLIECCDWDSRIVECAVPAGILNPGETTAAMAHGDSSHLRVGLRLHRIICFPAEKAEIQPFVRFPMNSEDKETKAGFCLKLIEDEEAKLGVAPKPPPGLAQSISKSPTLTISPDDGSGFKLVVQMHAKCFGLSGTVEKCTFADQSGKNGPDVEVAGGEKKEMKFGNKKSYKFHCPKDEPPKMRPPTTIAGKIARVLVPIGV